MDDRPMVHDFSPILVHVYGDLAIRWYGLSYILGFLFGYMMVLWLAARQKQGLTPPMISDFAAYAALGTLIGGRLGYCLFYSPDLFMKFKSEFPFWGVLAVNEGGMASHGGMIGLVIACTLFAMKTGVSQLYLYDLVALVGPVGIFFGRIANFINGELLGRPAPEDFPLAVKFPTEIEFWPAEQPARLGDLAPIADQVGISSSKWLEWVDAFRTDSSARENVYNGLRKIVESIQDGNTAVKEALAPMLTPRHPSQLYAAVAEGLVVFLILLFLWRKPRRPGVIGCWFVILYAIARISVEHYRLPDSFIGYQWLELTRGQWLSIGMLLIGLILLFIWGRREALPVPGWRRDRNLKIHRR